MDFKQQRNSRIKENGSTNQGDKNGSISETRGRAGTSSENYEKFDEILR